MNGLAVISCSSRRRLTSMPAPSARWYRVLPVSSSALALCTLSSTAASSRTRLVSFSRRCIVFSMVWRSARISSVVMVSMSPAASTEPSTRVTSGSAKARVTWQIASASRMLARNMLPRPSPSLAPLTMPAMSTRDPAAGSRVWLPKISASYASREPGTGTTPTSGTLVADDKFTTRTTSRGTAEKRVNLPTLGGPTIPIVRATGGDSTGRGRSGGRRDDEPLVSPRHRVRQAGLVRRRFAEERQRQASQRGARDPRLPHHHQQAGAVRHSRLRAARVLDGERPEGPGGGAGTRQAGIERVQVVRHERGQVDARLRHGDVAAGGDPRLVGRLARRSRGEEMTGFRLPGPARLQQGG